MTFLLPGGGLLRPMSVILFEDDLATQLYPVTVGKPAFVIGCGSYRLVDGVSRLGHAVSWIVRPHLRQLYPSLAAEQTPTDAPILLINAALVPSAAVLQQLGRLLEEGRPGVVRARKRVLVALLPPDVAPPSEQLDAEGLHQYFRGLELPAFDVELPYFEYPHDIVRYHLESLSSNLEDRLRRGEYQQLADGVFVRPGVQLGQHIVTDTQAGPIIVEDGATIGPYCHLVGPMHIGPAARVIEHAAIKDGVALGHTTKIGGEIEASIIEPYTNKQHHGFMGHSYLGSWINLGAGTCNSDLKNTYGQVNIEYQGRKVPTGMQFIGCMIGDYSKTAINTGIFTGKTIGVCSMVYGFVTTNVPSFVNYARLFGQVTETPVDVMIATQERMFARRNVTQRDADKQLLRDMYELTRHERQMAGEPLIL